MTRTAAGTTNVVRLDLRDWADGSLPEVAGGALVLDRADTLVEHAEIYQSLVGDRQVSGVVCLAVGESSTADSLSGAVLTVPIALKHAAVLWVGDLRGVEWAPDVDRVRPAEPDEPEGFGQLVAALLVPEVFDRVIAVTGGLPGAVASPGIRVVSSAAEAGELAEARAGAVESLTGPDHVRMSAGDDLLTTALRLGSADEAQVAGLVAGSPLYTMRRDAVLQLERVENLVRLLGTWGALAGDRRPTATLGTDVVQAGQRAERYRLGLVELFYRMDGHLQLGEPGVGDVVELGVQPPAEVRRAEVAAGLRELVGGRLAAGVSLPSFAAELRHAAAGAGPQGCATALDQFRAAGPLQLDMPPFRRWPLPAATVPLIIVTCAVAAFGLGPGWPGWTAGGLLAVAWFGAGWLLLGRRPDAAEEYGLRAAAAPAVLVYGLPGVVGTVVGAVVAALVPRALRLSATTGQLLVALAVLLLVGTVVLSWLSAVRRWRRSLEFEDLRRTVGALTGNSDRAVAQQWRPSQRRRAVAMALEAVAVGLEEINGGLRESADRLFVPPRSPVAPPRSDTPVGMIRAVPPELLDVVRSDLVGLCGYALEPAWAAAESGRRSMPGIYVQRLERLLGEYGTHVAEQGLMTGPRFAHDLGPRDRQMVRVWAESPEAPAALLTGVDGPMTQLCTGRQLSYLSTVATPGLVRFAPRQVRRVLELDGSQPRLLADSGVVWSAGKELVGAMRLLPLRLESVVETHGGGEVR